MRYIGRKISVGFGKETTRGTAVSATSWIAISSLDFDDKFENVIEEGSLGTIVDSSDSHNTKKWAEGSIEGNAHRESLGLLLLSVFGQVASTETVGTGAYDHLYTLANSNQHQSLTLVTDEDNGDNEFSLAMVEEMKISAAMGEHVKVSVTFKSKAGVITTATTNFDANDSVFLARHGLFSIDGLAVPCKSYEVTFTKNLEEDFECNSADVYDILNKQFAITGSIEFDYDSNTFKDYATGGVKKSISIVITDNDTVIGASDNPTLSISLDKVSFPDWTRNKGNDEIVNQVLEFKAHYDLNSGSIGSVLLRNTTASY